MQSKEKKGKLKPFFHDGEDLIFSQSSTLSTLLRGGRPAGVYEHKVDRKKKFVLSWIKLIKKKRQPGASVCRLRHLKQFDNIFNMPTMSDSVFFALCDTLTRVI